jgi:hypothetical protein
MVVWMIDLAPRHPFKRIAIALHGPHIDPNSDDVCPPFKNTRHAPRKPRPMHGILIEFVIWFLNGRDHPKHGSRLSHRRNPTA